MSTATGRRVGLDPVDLPYLHVAEVVSMLNQRQRGQRLLRPVRSRLGHSSTTTASNVCGKPAGLDPDVDRAARQLA